MRKNSRGFSTRTQPTPTPSPTCMCILWMHAVMPQWTNPKRIELSLIATGFLYTMWLSWVGGLGNWASDLNNDWSLGTSGKWEGWGEQEGYETN